MESTSFMDSKMSKAERSQLSTLILDQETEIRFLDSRISGIEGRAVEADLSILRQEQQLRLERLRSLRIAFSPIERLPLETLAEIFRVFRLSFRFRGTYDPWLLIRICHEWRELASSLPELWSEVTFKVRGGPLAVEGAMDMLRKANPCFPVHMEIDFSDASPTDCLQDIMHPFSGLFGHITTIGGSQQFYENLLPSPMGSLQVPCPILHHLSVRQSVGVDGTLQDLEFDVRSVNIPWSQLTTLDLSFPVTSTLIREILTWCIRLETCTLIINDDPSSVLHTLTAPLVPITLPVLRDATFRTSDWTAATSHLLNALTLPGLKALTFDPCHYPQPVASLISLKVRSLWDLQSMCLANADVQPAELSLLLRDLPSLSELELLYLTHPLSQEFIAVLHPGMQGQQIAPALVELHLVSKLVESTLDWIITMLESRAPQSGLTQKPLRCARVRKIATRSGHSSLWTYDADIHRRVEALKSVGMQVDLE